MKLIISILQIATKALQNNPFLITLVIIFAIVVSVFAYQQLSQLTTLIIAFLAIFIIASIVITSLTTKPVAIFTISCLALFIIFIITWLNRSNIYSNPERRIKKFRVKTNLQNSLIIAQKLPQETKKQIIERLKIITEDVANYLNIDHKLIRANLFGVDLDYNRLKIISDLTYNMTDQNELTISMAVGYGSTGRCFQSKDTNIAIFNQGWADNSFSEPDISKVHHDLKWVISIPIFLIDSENNPQPFFVLNIDGIKQSFNEDKLKKIVGKIFPEGTNISFLVVEGLKSIE